MQKPQMKKKEKNLKGLNTKMADDQKYYYMRLKDGFFEEDAVKIIESMQDGYLYSNILLKLYLKSLKFSGKLMYNERIPYNPTVLATITGHKVGVIEKALNIFKELDLIEILDNGAIYMLDIQNLIGRSSTEADRKREYRAKIEAEKAFLLTGGQMSGQISPEIEIEKEIEIETEKEEEKKKKNKKKAAIYAANEDLNNAILSFIDFRKKLKKPMTERAIELMINKLNEMSKDINVQIEIINQSILNGWQGIFPLKQEQSTYKPQPKKNRFNNFEQRKYDNAELERMLLNPQPQKNEHHDP